MVLDVRKHSTSKRVHDSCYRRPYYDAGMFVETFDDENAKRGYCLYKVGCKGPSTYNACGVMRWNNGTSFIPSNLVMGALVAAKKASGTMVPFTSAWSMPEASVSKKMQIRWV